MKQATEAKTNPKAVWKYMIYIYKYIPDLNTDPKDPKSRLTDSDREKADVLGNFLSSVFTIEPNDDIPHIPPVKLRHNMEELTIDEEIIFKKT